MYRNKMLPRNIKADQYEIYLNFLYLLYFKDLNKKSQILLFTLLVK